MVFFVCKVVNLTLNFVNNNLHMEIINNEILKNVNVAFGFDFGSKL